MTKGITAPPWLLGVAIKTPWNCATPEALVRVITREITIYILHVLLMVSCVCFFQDTILGYTVLTNGANFDLVRVLGIRGFEK